MDYNKSIFNIELSTFFIKNNKNIDLFKLTED